MQKIGILWEKITALISKVVGSLVCLWIVILFCVSIYDHLFGEVEHKAKAGDSCGIGAHWIWVGPPDPYGDLSCEDDKKP